MATIREKLKLFNVTLVLAFAAELLFLVPYLAFPPSQNYTATVLPAVLADLANSERKERNISSLKPNSLLTQAAQLKAEDMASKGYFSHTGPNGEKPWAWLKKVGYDYLYAGENLALNFSDSGELNRAWMNSPAHRGNVLKREFTEIGLGVAEGTFSGQKAVVVVEFFGTPASMLLNPSSDLTPWLPSRVTPGLVAWAEKPWNYFFMSLSTYPSSPSAAADTFLFLLVVLILLHLAYKFFLDRSSLSRRSIVRHLVLVVLIIALICLNLFLAGRGGKIALEDIFLL